MLAANCSASLIKKHSYKSKWNILFDKSPEWISFKPQLGLKVYPCYSCKNMFSSKLTFQDHINRRVIIIKYKCIDCTNVFTFYNRCAFLLHARKHFPLAQGQINLENIDIHILPVELAGFARHENIPFLYDEEEEFSDGISYINCQFYTPDDTEAGKQFITLKPFNLVFHYAEGQNMVLLVLKQISFNFPLCEFVNQNRVTNVPDIRQSNGILEPEIKQEVEDEEFTIPVISKIESLNKEDACPECGMVPDIPIVGHFLGTNRPLDISIICSYCKYVAPTRCCLRAHVRTHENKPPFVCPECGKLFQTSSLLHNHMENVCFHLNKNVRFRCPVPKCGKLFVLPNTYTSHFITHMQCYHRCSYCSSVFVQESDFHKHAKNHESCTSIRQYSCSVCKDKCSMSYEESTEHITWHLQDRERCVYIYTCKYCRSYFRSTGTFSAHKKRCHKTDKSQNVQTVNCQFCPGKIQFKDKETFKTCLSCKQINQVRKWHNSGHSETTLCVLCKKDLSPDERRTHSFVCKYNNPVVNIQTLNDTNVEETSSSEKMSDSECKLDSSNDSIRADTPKSRKRKRSFYVKVKKTEENDLKADTPISFDGTYYCKLCDYKSTDRCDFHNHIVVHRDVSTAYQCMECGECFVVKPSLVKHLTHYHKVVDVDKYFSENECYDKGAIEKLEKNQRLVLGEHKESVKKDQCSICLKQCEDAAALDKHFRIHGMAFLLKKTK